MRHPFSLLQSTCFLPFACLKEEVESHDSRRRILILYRLRRMTHWDISRYIVQLCGTMQSAKVPLNLQNGSSL